MDLATNIRNTQVNGDEIALYWLGQAGFLLKDAAGRSLIIDPYLTDCGWRIKQQDPAFKRLSPMLLNPADVEADLYVVTHHHFDHFDYDAVPVVAKRKTVMFCGPQSVQPLLNEAGVDESHRMLLDVGMALEHAGIRVTATYADHGEMAPDCIGAFVEMGGVKVWFAGDTAYHPERMAEIAAMKPDVAVVSINGEFGNLTAEQGAMVARDTGARMAVPCHFWTFLQHRGEPWLFGPRVAELAPGCTPVYLRQGERIFITNKG